MPCPSVRIHCMVFRKIGSLSQPAPERFCGASRRCDTNRSHAESFSSVQSLERLDDRESDLLQVFSGRMVSAASRETCHPGASSSGPFYECLVQLSSDAETAVLFVDSDAFEPCNVWGLEASVGNANRPSVYGCDYESRVLVGEPVVPDLREIVMAAPDLLRDL